MNRAVAVVAFADLGLCRCTSSKQKKKHSGRGRNALSILLHTIDIVYVAAVVVSKRVCRVVGRESRWPSNSTNGLCSSLHTAGT